MNRKVLYRCFWIGLIQLMVLAIQGQDSVTIDQDSANRGLVRQTVSRSMLLLGAQVPLQFTAGFGYVFSHRLSARVHAGIITRPFSGFIVDAMEAFGMDEQLARVIRKAFQRGTVLGMGPNYHFGSNYLGIFGQYLHLKGGGITPADALSVYFKKDFSQLDLTGLPVFEFSMQSSMFNAGALFGHQFRLRNPRFSINAEVGLSKIITSTNRFASNRSLIDRTAFVQNLYKELNQEMKDAYWKYGFIPTVNGYLVYHL